MRRDVVLVTVSIGDTMIARGEADGPFAFDWAPEHVLVPPADGEPPVRTRIGIADVTLHRDAAPERTLPYTSDLDPRACRYLAISLAVHLLLWGVATTYTPPPEIESYACGEAREPVDPMLVAIRGGSPAAPAAAPSDEGSVGPVVSMRLAARSRG